MTDLDTLINRLNLLALMLIIVFCMAITGNVAGYFLYRAEHATLTEDQQAWLLRCNALTYYEGACAERLVGDPPEVLP